MADLAVFAFVFIGIVLLIPLAVVRVWHAFVPDFQVADIPPTAQLLMQALIDLATLGFIAFLIRVVHGQSFTETIHWRKDYQLGTAFLISLGATLAVSVMIISSFFPLGDPPIQKLFSSTTAMYVFVIFGVAGAPLFEEIMFRGFLFKLFSDIWGAGKAVPVTALLFGLLHLLQLWGSWAGVVLIFGVGYVLSLLRQRTNSVIPSIIVHTSYNGLLFGAFALNELVQKIAH
jgi:membrane protease YdiL (CAAX protease family)